MSLQNLQNAILGPTVCSHVLQEAAVPTETAGFDGQLLDRLYARKITHRDYRVILRGNQVGRRDQRRQAPTDQCISRKIVLDAIVDGMARSSA